MKMEKFPVETASARKLSSSSIKPAFKPRLRWNEQNEVNEGSLVFKRK